jgi:hypothetical protein
LFVVSKVLLIRNQWIATTVSAKAPPKKHHAFQRNFGLSGGFSTEFPRLPMKKISGGESWSTHLLWTLKDDNSRNPVSGNRRRPVKVRARRG